MRAQTIRNAVAQAFPGTHDDVAWRAGQRLVIDPVGEPLERYSELVVPVLQDLGIGAQAVDASQFWDGTRTLVKALQEAQRLHEQEAA